MLRSLKFLNEVYMKVYFNIPFAFMNLYWFYPPWWTDSKMTFNFSCVLDLHLE